MPRPKTHTQTVLFNKAIWHDRISVRNWLRRHQMDQEGIDETANFFRARQLPPDKFIKGSLRTITLSKADGLESVIGHLKEGSSMATKKASKKTAKKTSKAAKTTSPKPKKAAKKAAKKAPAVAKTAKKKAKRKTGPVDPSRARRPGETFPEHMARLRGSSGKLKKLEKRHTKAEDALRAEEERLVYERGKKALLAAGVSETKIPPAKKARKKAAKKVAKKAVKTSRAKARHAAVQRAAKRAMATAKAVAKKAAAKAKATAKRLAARAKAAAKKAAAKAKAEAVKARKQAARVAKTHAAKVRRAKGKKA
jgi:colicin import membrane protein